MYTGALPPASIHGTWVDNIEILSADDDTQWDTSALSEVTVELRDPVTGWAELSLRLSEGRVTLPAPGIIQWRAEPEEMGTLATKMYECLIVLEDATDVVPLVIGSISVIE